MDWNAAIERNREALKRVLAALFAMAHIANGDDRPAPLPRILHSAILRLLRPAEAAARRLVIIAARRITIAVSPPAPGAPLSGVRQQRPRHRDAAGPLRIPSLPLFDPPLRWRPARPRSPACLPRISVPGFTTPSPLRRPPNPFDELDTTRLAARLKSVGAALDDLPKHALRFAKWKARRDALAANIGDRSGAAVRRVWPLRPGRPPGRHSRRDRRPPHEVHSILDTTHGLAIWALEPRDTS